MGDIKELISFWFCKKKQSFLKIKTLKKERKKKEEKGFSPSKSRKQKKKKLGLSI